MYFKNSLPLRVMWILSSFLMLNNRLSMYVNHCSKTVVSVPLFFPCCRFVVKGFEDPQFNTIRRRVCDFDGGHLTPPNGSIRRFKLLKDCLRGDYSNKNLFFLCLVCPYYAYQVGTDRVFTLDQKLVVKQPNEFICNGWAGFGLCGNLITCGRFNPARADLHGTIDKAYERLLEEHHRNNCDYGDRKRPSKNFQVQCLVLMRLVDRSMTTGTPSSLHAMA